MSQTLTQRCSSVLLLVIYMSWIVITPCEMSLSNAATDQMIMICTETESMQSGINLGSDTDQWYWSM